MKTLITCIMLLYVQLSFTQVYIPIPVGDAQWIETEYSMVGPAFDKSYSIFSMDTVSYTAFGHPYKKYEIIKDSVYNLAALETSFYIFDDSIARKIYMHLNNNEYLIYDFSKNAGDTINNIYPVPYVSGFNGTSLIVDSITAELFHGVLRKVFFLSDLSHTITTIWIEGIGSKEGIFNNIAHAMPTDPVWAMNCLHQNNVPLYGNVCTFKTVGMNDFRKPIENIKIASNPVLNNEIEILNPDNTALQWQLMSAEGLILAKGNSLKIPVSGYADGLIFLQIITPKSKGSYKILK